MTSRATMTPRIGIHDTTSDSHDDGRDDHAADKPAQAEKPNRDDRQGGEETAKNGNDGNESQTADNTGKGDGQTAGQGDNPATGQQAQGVNAQAAAQASALDATIVANAVGGIAHTEQGPASDTGKVNAAAALANAATAGQRQAGVHSAQADAGQHQSQGQQNGNAQQAGQQADAGARANTTLQQQTAQLAQTLGQDAKVKVDVTVGQEAETLSSRPTATLTAGTALASDNKGQAQNGQQANTHAAQNGQNAAAQVGAAQAQGGQAQTQGQQSGGQGNQAQNAVQTTASAQASSGGNAGVHSAGPTAAGGEQANAAQTAAGANGPQQTHQTQHAQQAAQTARPHQPLQSSVAEQVSVRITKALADGQDRITIRLNPAELGRVEVKMELTHDGRTTAVVTADNRETLDLLRRDSSDLQKALEEGGLQLSDSDLTFNLRGEEGQTAEDGDGKLGTGGGEEEVVEEFVEQQPEVIVAHEGGVLIHGRLDVRA
ncbi:MAG: flagellar hook-length control protein FliK [Rhodospirillaceae bacterium]